MRNGAMGGEQGQKEEGAEGAGISMLGELILCIQNSTI